jgi:hypothetical protein
VPSPSPPRHTGSASVASQEGLLNRRPAENAVPPTTTTPPGSASAAINGLHSWSPRVETASHGVFAVSGADCAGPVSPGGRRTPSSAGAGSAVGSATSTAIRPVGSAGARPWRRRGHGNRSISSVGTSTDNSCSLPMSTGSRWFRLDAVHLAHPGGRGESTSCACSTHPSGRGCPVTGSLSRPTQHSPHSSTPPVSTMPGSTDGVRPAPGGPAGRCVDCSACSSTVMGRWQRAR